MWIDYDAKVDVFYISFPRPQRASDSEARDDGIIIHRCGKQVVALAITEARKG